MKCATLLLSLIFLLCIHQGNSQCGGFCGGFCVGNTTNDFCGQKCNLVPRSCLGTGVTTCTGTSGACPCACCSCEPTCVTFQDCCSDYSAFCAIPTVATVTPSSSIPTTGQTLTLQGDLFGTQNAGSRVFLDGTTTSVTVLTWSARTITVTLPAGCGANHYFVVSNGTRLGPISPFFNYSSPVISTIGPTTGANTDGRIDNNASATIVTVTGTSFCSIRGNVYWNGVNITGTVTSWTTTGIQFPLPRGTGTGNIVQVATFPDPAYFASTTYAYSRPTIVSITPVGLAAGGVVTITGRSFGSNMGLTNVTVAGQLCPLVTLSDRSLTCTLPVWQGANQQFIVTCSGQTSPTGTGTTYSYPRPTITSISPTSGITSGSTNITLIGTNLGTGASVVVNWGTTTTSTLLFWNNTYGLFRSLAGPQVTSTPTINVALTIASQTSTNSVSFTYSPPVVTSISPTTGAPVGGGALVITGTGFGPNIGYPTVSVGGQNCSTTAVTQTQITCTLPAGSGQVPVLVSVCGVTSTAFLYNYTRPALTRITPTNGPCDGSTVVTIVGTSFGVTGTRSVTIGGQAALLNGSWNDTTIICTAPAWQGVNQQVVVTVTGLASTATTVIFTYDRPVLNSISPVNLPTQGGVLTLSGFNFGSVAGTVIVNNIACNVTSWSNLNITCNAPPGMTQNVTLNVTAAGQSLRAGGSPFLSYDFPNFTAINPTSGTVAGGSAASPITLIGTSFGNPTGRVFFGTTQLTVLSWSSSQITVVHPAGVGIVNFRVQNSLGRNTTTVPFSYLPPSITSINPSAMVTGGPTSRNATISGTEFGSAANTLVQFQLDGAWTNTTVFFANYSSIQLRVPVFQGAPANVRVVVGGTVGNVRTFSWLEPFLTGISPTNGPVAGGINVTIIGSSLGFRNGSAWIGSNPCNVLPGSQIHTQLVCVLPQGVGAGIVVSANIEGLQNNNLLPVTFSYDPPIVSTIITTNLLTDGGNLTLIGRNFWMYSPGITPLVVIDGINSCNVLDSNETYILCTLGSGQGTGHTVQVTVGGQTVLNGTFSYRAPVVTSVSPSTGSPLGGQNMTIVGTSFGFSGLVTFSGAPCQESFRNHTLIYCTLPIGAGLDIPVIVSAGGVSSGAFLWGGYQGPVLDSVTPVILPTDGTVVLTLLGTNFGTVSRQVLVGNSPCLINFWNNTYITCLSPQGQGANQSVLIVANNQNSSGILVSYLPPYISRIVAANGPTQGGYRVLVDGSNLGLSGTILFGGNSVCTVSNFVTDWGHTQVTCVVPPGSGNVSVTIDVGGQSPLPGGPSLFFVYDPPQIFSTLPAPLSGSTGGGNPSSPLTIYGTSFGNVTGSVWFDSFATPWTIVSWTHTQIAALHPTASGTNFAAYVQTALGQQSNRVSFTFNPPTIDTFFPVNSTTRATALLTINGNSFGSNATTSVVIGFRQCVNFNVTSTRILCRIPEGEGVNLQVTVTSGQSVNAFQLFNYFNPTISRVIPATAPTQGGTNMTIVGTNLGISQGRVVGSLCYFQNHTHAMFPMPEGQGPIAIQHSFSFPNAPLSNAIWIRYDAPEVWSITPANGPTLGGYNVTVTGINLGNIARITVGDYSCNVRIVRHFFAICLLPAGDKVNQTVSAYVGLLNSAQLNVTFSFDPPLITRVITPALVYTEGGASISIQGLNFGVTAPSVYIDGSACLVTTYTATTGRLNCTVPPGQGRNVELQVVSPAGQLSNIFLFNYTAPIVTGITPNNGPARGRATVTVTGLSFGTTALVSIDGNACSVLPGTQVHRSVQCSTPPGSGLNKSVVVNVLGADSRPFYGFNYDPPNIDVVSPNNGPTIGQEITLSGFNFGDDTSTARIISSVSGNATACSITLRQDTYLTCNLTEGVGTIQLRLIVSNLLSNWIPFYYFPPRLSSLTPTNGPTQGGYQLVLFGTNFGPSNATRVFFQTQPNATVCPLVLSGCNHTVVTCIVPPGLSPSIPINVDTAGQQSAVSLVFNYDPPAISTIRGCSTNVGNGTMRCLNQGGNTITITGINFGPVGSVVQILIVGLGNCTNISQINHTAVTCRTPQGNGVDLVVQLILSNSRVASASGLLSYLSPEPDFSTLRLFSNRNMVGQIYLNNTITSERIELSGQGFGLDSRNITVTYGLPSDSSSWRSCLVNATASNSTYILCTLTNGVGGNLSLRVSVFNNLVGLQVSGWSDPSVGSISYPRPQLLSGTIRTAGSTITGSSVRGTQSGGEFLVFAGQFLGLQTNAAAQVSVSYGPVGVFPKPFGCTAPVLDKDNTANITCLTQAGQDGPYVFQVRVLNQDSDEGTDQYSYPIPPTVTRVSGCTDQGNRTTDCPTAGGVRLTLFGTAFAAEATIVKIGISVCTAYTYFNETTATCVLAPGAGSAVPVVVTVGVLFSASMKLVDYALPVVTRVSGCIDQGNTTVNCGRSAGQVATIWGTNLSPRGAIVLVNGVLADSFHDALTPNEKVYFTVPRGKGLGVPVLLIQGDGEAANLLSLSYERCPPSTRESLAADSIACLDCEVGRFSGVSGSLGCTVCEPGQFSNTTGLSACYRCPAGFISSTTEATVCRACDAGTWAANEGLSACAQCSVGEYTGVNASTSCTACEPGRLGAVTGLTACINCTRGFVAPVKGSASCLACAPGRYATLDGSLECLRCEAGKFQSQSGATSCVPCTKGSAIESSGQDSCRACASGTFANDTGLETCRLCPAGFFSSAQGGNGPIGCTPCPPGSFSPEVGQAVCLFCPLGRYSNYSGTIQCPTCDEGTYSDTIGSQQCQPCSAGTYSGFPEASICTLCPLGTYAIQTGQSTCEDCNPGYFQSSQGSVQCSGCPVGTSNAVDGQPSCQPCSSGTFSSGLGAARCQSCSAGTFSIQQSSVEGPTTCQSCPAGRFTSTTQQSVCVDCPVGTFQPYSGQSECQPCPAGTFAGLPASKSCTQCTPGRYSTQASVVCFDCPIGYVSTGLGAPCTACPAGSVAPSPGMSSCIACSRGSYVGTTAQASCFQCSYGEFANRIGSIICDKCSPGYYQDGLGQIGCIACPLGRYSGAQAQASCLLCPFGTVATTLAQDTCSNCPTGKYSPVLGGTVCLDCGLGFFSNIEGTITCSDCPAGSFSNQTGSTGCFSCQPGQFQASIRQSSCDSCRTGTVSAISGQSQCVGCPAGTFTNSSGSRLCAPCPAGTRQPLPGQSSCVNCVAGTFSQSSSSLACDLCPSGTYSSARESTCRNCAAGRYQPALGQPDCLDCNPGSAQISDAQTSCPLCAPGRFANTSGQIECQLCEAGYYSGGGATRCLSCDVGTFGATQGQIGCTGCPSGTFNNDTSQVQCNSCQPGFYQPNPSSLSCLPCAAGRYSALPNAVACEVCPVGKVSNATASTCADCEPGSYQPATEQSVCLPCAPGTYTESSAQSECIACPSGRFSVPSGSTKCDICPAGQYQVSTGQVYCDRCPSGKFSDTAGGASCISCRLGEYNNATGLTECWACEVGRASAVAAASACAPCVPGEYSNVIGALSCRPCPSGSFSNSFGALTCEPCAIGKYQSTFNKTSCDSCPSGTFSLDAGQARCVACGLGTYSNQSEASECVRCEMGRFQDQANSTACQLCPLGSFTSSLGSVVCDLCAPGTYAPVRGLFVCDQCPPGRSNPLSGQIECSNCTVGRARADPGQTNCPECGPGLFAAMPGQVTCEPCKAGSFGPKTGLSSCELCSQGRFIQTLGQPACDDCTIGRYTSYKGAIACDLCPTGKYGGAIGAPLCVDCGIGKYAPVLGMKECIVSPIGYYNPAPGANSSVPCNPGYYQQLLGRASCDPCLAGSFQREFGQSQCTPCAVGRLAPSAATVECALARPGFYVPRDGWSEPELPCGPGTYQPAAGQVECISCPLGKYMDVYNATACIDCAPGSYGDIENALNCTLCPIGSFIGISGQLDCLPCPPGRFGNRSGLAQCETCPSGTIQPLIAQTNCSACPEATFSISTTECVGCPAGRSNNITGQLQCQECPPGRAQNRTGQLTCRSCPQGTFSPLPLQEICRSCPPGTYTNTTNSHICQTCDVGYFNPNSSALSCSPCGFGTYAPTREQQHCEDCGLGTFNNQTAQRSCEQCPAGSYQSVLGASRCELCRIGSFSVEAGQAECQLCPPARYGNRNGMTACELCPVGQYQNSFNQTICLDCLAGTFSNTLGRAFCLPCPQGSFTALNGTNTTCPNCAEGYYSDRLGATRCEACDPGKFSSVDHTLCKLCPPGYYNNDSAQAACTPCPLNTFQNETGRVACDACPPGTFAQGAAEVCSPCPAGTQRDVWQSNCTDCNPGRYAPVATPLCFECPRGKFSQAGRPACDDCPTGRHQANLGQANCSLCDPGSYQDEVGQVDCKVCAKGRANRLLGQVDCSPCEAGRFSNQTSQEECQGCALGAHQNVSGQSYCFSCEPGRYASLPALVECAPCEPGRSALLYGSPICDECAAGYFATEYLSETCQACPKGRSANGTGFVECQLCGKGAFANSLGSINCDLCYAGFFQDLVGSLECKSCEAGYFSADRGVVECLACIPGKYSSQVNSSGCLSCPDGSVQDLPGATFCTVCPNGTYSPADSAKTTCTACTPGSFSLGNATECTDCPGGQFAEIAQATTCLLCPEGKRSKAVLGSDSCEECGDGLVAPDPGTTVCTACEALAIPNSEGTECVCLSGYYDDEVAGADFNCRSCPVGADCRSLGTKWSNMKTLPNWWRSSNDTLRFYRCEYGSQCLAGSAATCTAHRSGPICAICDPGYFSFFGGECRPCPSRSGIVVYLVFLIFCAAMAYIFMNAFLLYTARSMMRLEKDRQMINHARTEKGASPQEGEEEIVMSAMPRLTAVRPEFNPTIQNVEIRNELHLHDMINNWQPKYIPTDEHGVILKVVDGKVKYGSNFTYKLKILISFLQIMTNIGVGLELPWPSGFKSFISFFSFANFDLVQASNLECMIKQGDVYYNKLVFMCFVPFIVLAGLVCIYTIPKMVQIHRSKLPDHEKVLARKRAGYKSLRIILFSLFLLYPTVSSTVIRTFNCKTIDGVHYLVADFNTLCYTPKWNRYIPLAAVFTFIFPVGIPLLFFLLTFKLRHRLQDPGVRVAVGILYNGFEPRLWWFEMLDMLHKLILVCTLPFFPFDAQLPFALSLVGIYLIAILLARPYKRDSDDGLHVAAQCLLFLMIYSGWLLRANTIETSTDIVLSFLMIIMTMGMVVYAAWSFVKYIYVRGKIMYGNYLKRREEEESAVLSSPTSATPGGGQHQRVASGDSQGRSRGHSQGRSRGRSRGASAGGGLSSSKRAVMETTNIGSSHHVITGDDALMENSKRSLISWRS